MNERKELIANMLRQATQPVYFPRNREHETESISEGLENFSTSGEFVPLLKNQETIVETVTLNNQQGDQALESIEQVIRGNHLTDLQADAAEAIILTSFRPCIDIINGSFQEFPHPWETLQSYKHVIDTAIGAVGRIEVPNLATVPYGGTGFLVGENLLLTNRHVAELFTSGLGIKQLLYKADIGAAVDFKQEVIPTAPQLITIKKTEMLHPYWDAALLSVEGLKDVKPLTLMSNPPSVIKSRSVVVIGYPMIDYRNDLEMQNKIFKGVYGKKRLLPGTLMGYETIKSFNKPVEALTHDSSTLGGNSGSLLLDLETGQVLGLHFAGLYMKANFAVPSWQLAYDNKLVDFGVQFGDGKKTDTTPPSWLNSWDDLKEYATKFPADEPFPTTVPEKLSRIPTVSDWFERTTNEEIAAAYFRDPEGTRSLLYQTLIKDEAKALLADLEDNAVVSEVYRPGSESTPNHESMFGSRINPDLPEIIFLHGITGSHLANSSGLVSRVWLNPLAFLFGNVAEKLTLTNDGLHDAQTGSKLMADGHIRYVYDRPARTWRKKGFVVHEFSFDWRKSISQSADRLHLFIENLKIERAVNQPFVIVAHSMGGLVAALYAQRHREWSDRIGQAFLLGSPLRGSYAPIEAVLGTYPFLLKLAKLSRLDDVTDLRRMARTLPGLLDMLPDPAIFPDVAPMYRQQTWPDSLNPTQAWLTQSETLKTLYRESPLLARSIGIVSLDHGTVGTLENRDGRLLAGPRTLVGDGTVPGKSAVIPNRPNYKVPTVHALIPRDPLAIEAISDLIRIGDCALPNVKPDEDLDDVINQHETSATTPHVAIEESIKTRMENSLFTQADFDWLVSPTL